MSKFDHETARRLLKWNPCWNHHLITTIATNLIQPYLPLKFFFESAFKRILPFRQYPIKLTRDKHIATDRRFHQMQSQKSTPPPVSRKPKKAEGFAKDIKALLPRCPGVCRSSPITNTIDFQEDSQRIIFMAMVVTPPSCKKNGYRVIFCQMESLNF